MTSRSSDWLSRFREDIPTVCSWASKELRPRGWPLQKILGSLNGPVITSLVVSIITTIIRFTISALFR